MMMIKDRLMSNQAKLNFSTGKLYNVSRALDSRGMYDQEKYMDYSAAYLGAANTVRKYTSHHLTTRLNCHEPK